MAVRKDDAAGASWNRRSCALRWPRPRPRVPRPRPGWPACAAPAAARCRPSLQQAQAAASAAQAEFDRVAQLVAQGFLSASRLDDARRARDVALAQLAAARAQVQAVADSWHRGRAGPGPAATGRRRHRRGTAPGWPRRGLRAPADAQVLARQVEPGQIVQPGRALLTLALNGPTAAQRPRSTSAFSTSWRWSSRRRWWPTPIRDAALPHGCCRLRRRWMRSVARSRSSSRWWAMRRTFLREDMTLSIEVETGRRARALVVPMAALTRRR